MGTGITRPLGIPGLLDVVPIGGSHLLYRAHQLSMNRMVALRLLDGELDDDDAARSNYVLCALRALSGHPHVVTVCGSGHTPDGRAYVLLELLEEGSLAQWVADDGRLPYGEVLNVALKIVGALDTAHRAGVVHGHLRPESILVSPSGEPRLAGLDRAVFRHVRAAFTEGAGMPSVADDVSALASTMFTLLTAAKPGDPWVENALERCEVPVPVRGLVERFLASGGAFRPTSIRDLAAAIQYVQQVLGLAVTDAVVDESAAEEARQALSKATAPPAEPELELEWERWSEFALSEPEAGPEPEPEVDLAESDPWPQLVGLAPEPLAEPGIAYTDSPRPARRRRRNLVMLFGLVLLTAAALAGVHLLGARRTPRPEADQQPLPVVVEQPVGNRDVAYTGFRTISDQSGKLSVIVPEEWSVIRSSPWMVDGEAVGAQLEATLAGSTGEAWSRPGVVLATSETLGSHRTASQVLDQLQQLRMDQRQCDYQDRQPFNDSLYRGVIDSYTHCGQTDANIELLVATSKKHLSHLVLVAVIRLGPRDEGASDRVMETFQVK